ncbi:hypothetical protein [Longitalea luteola]|uniref:hypothetical protein n=1 Tax=Longitalea luteola TaxID=2812563 RepID=UPI001A97C990|nr:hypothetical protein [Longitalea luteola]
MNLADKITLLQTTWNKEGSSYAKEINAMIAFIEEHGYENWKGIEPADNRNELAPEVLSLLKKANKEDNTSAFRAMFPPAYAPFVNIIHEQGQCIENLCYISNNKIAFVIGSVYEKRKAYTLTNRTIQQLPDTIQSIGRSHRNDIFAIAAANTITTYKGWQGSPIAAFNIPLANNQAVSQVIPFNDGLSVLLISPEGIYLLTANGHSLIHPVPDPEDKEWASYIDMEHAALSHDDSFIVVGDQNSYHRILNRDGHEIHAIRPQSSYPHYALFAKDGQQLVLNSCHFYSGITISVPATNLQDLKREDNTKEDRYSFIDKNSRIYAAVPTSAGYIFGDATGNIKAFDKQGKNSWRHFLGSTISSMVISDDEQTLWVASCSGMIHKLRLNAGQRDDHTIGNGNHYEEFRVIFWKNEPAPLVW